MEGSQGARRRSESGSESDQRIPNAGVAAKSFRQRWQLHWCAGFSSIKLEKVPTFANYLKGEKRPP